MKEVVEVLDILLTKKIAEKELKAKREKLETLIAKREEMATPDEARAKIDAEIASIKGLVIGEEIKTEVVTETVS